MGWGLVRLAIALFVALAPVSVRAQRSDDGEASRQILVMLRLPPPHLRLNESYTGAYGDSTTRAALRRVAARIARRSGLRLVEEWPMPLLGIDCFVMQVENAASVGAAIRSVSEQREVEWAQPMQIHETRSDRTRGDPLLPVQPSATAWHLAELHRVATGRGITVAVVDSRVETGHPDLAGQFIVNRDFIGGQPARPEEHGTGIAGVIAARGNNGIGIVGVAPAARLMALRACRETASSRSATCTTLSLARAIHFAIERGARVINLSLSGPPDPLLERLIAIALRRSSIVVAAYDPNLPRGGFPASEPGVVAVGDASLPALPPTVYGAPARDIPTTQPGGTWDLVNGPSYAAAHVSGLMALLRERGRPARLVRSDAGAVDACASLVQVTRTCDCACAIARQPVRRARR